MKNGAEGDISNITKQYHATNTTHTTKQVNKGDIIQNEAEGSILNITRPYDTNKPAYTTELAN